MRSLLLGALTALTITTANAAQQHNETEKFFKAIAGEMAALKRCYVEAASAYASKTCEPANIVLEVAFGACLVEEANFRNASLAAAPSLRDSADAGTLGMRDGSKSAMYRAIFDARVKQGHCVSPRW
jgi:hypothetical protein